MADLRTFNEILSAAIDDLIEHGYDSIERVQKWERELRLAAERSMVGSVAMEQKLNDALAAIYKKQVDAGAIMKLHQGIDRFTADMLKPQLRSELNRRIHASAGLIRLNQVESVEKVMRRFQGWSTSIPPGGVSAESKRDVKANVQKSLKQLPFEERRVLIDQGHKLVSSLSEIIAADGGAIAGIWRSNYRQPNYDYRPDHKERDDKVYLIRDSWAHRAGLVKRGKVGYYDEVDAPATAPFCRCYMIWLYNLRDLPPDMLTQAGRRKLVEVGMHTNATRAFARADAADLDLTPIPAPLLQEVVEADRMGFMRGVRRFEMVQDDGWHAAYDGGTVAIRPSFFAQPVVDQAAILLHELGHAGQDIKPRLFREFGRQHLANLRNFANIANPAHLEDYERTGQVDGGLAAEVFAESYARFCTGRNLPDDLKAFWSAQPDGLMTQREAVYGPWWPNRITRCARCSMFEPGIDPTTNRCTAVSGLIARSGHCKLFEIGGARADSVEDDIKPAVGYEAVRRRLNRLERQLLAGGVD